jgi:broad specificity phosphatase PhoE
MRMTPNTTLHVYLIRHGETEWSRSGHYTGITDIPLTAHGIDEARGLGQRLRSIPFAHVLTSPLQRSQSTCALAALGPIPVITNDLTEWDNGDDAGHTPAEVLALRPDWNLFRDGSSNGQTPPHVCARADRIISRLRTLDGNVALFSHSHFGRVLAVRWIGLSVEYGQYFLLNTASFSILGFNPRHLDVPVIIVWNAVTPEPTMAGGQPRTAIAAIAV